MTVGKYLKWSTLLSLSGVAFAGYLSGTKLFSQTCAFGESCPYFFGYPACYYGFLIFLTLFIISLGSLLTKEKSKLPVKIILLLSFIGILFAGNFVFQEIVDIFQNGFRLYGLGLPTCVYGLIFYVIIFLLSIKTLIRKK